jgi:hypothetical protein
VVAHERREFVAEALRSIERQTLPRSQFEVLLLKDFNAPELGPVLERLGAVVVDLPAGPLGAWLAQVQGRLRGELVAFLDDDDVFEPEKLELVLEDFRRAEPAIFLHHGTRPLADSNPNIPSAPTGPTRVRPAQTTVVTPAEWKGNFRGLWRSDAAFNLSSIVVRRAVLESFPEQLGRIEVSLSAYLFFAALRLNGVFLLDGRALTQYRRAEGFASEGTPAPRSAQRLSALARPRGRDAELLLGFVARLQFPACEAPLRAAQAQTNLVMALEGEQMGRSRVLSDLFTVFRYRPWRAVAAERAVLVDAVRFVLGPRWGRRSWERHRRGRPP